MRELCSKNDRKKKRKPKKTRFILHEGGEGKEGRLT
jgi:hypothetical protein